MKEILFRNADSLTGCEIREDGVFFTAESAARFTVYADMPGYYSFVFDCDLLYGDAWHDVIVTGADGSSIRYRVGLPLAQRETQAFLYLFAGENTIDMTGNYGSGTFYGLRCSDAPAPLPYMLSPTNDIFYLDRPRHLRIHLLHYDRTPAKIRWDFGTLPFTVRPSQAEGLLQGDALIRSELILSPQALSILPAGTHTLRIKLDDGQELPYTLTVKEKDEKAPFEILNFNVHHGSSTLLSLPNGRHLLIDSGKEECAQDIILPYLVRNGIHVDYYLLTHFHDDHDGMLEEILAQNSLRKPDVAVVEQSLTADASERYPYLAQFSYLDSRMVRPFDRLDRIWDLGGVEITVLNSRLDESGCPTIDMTNENNSSTSLAVVYGGLHYHHAADNYANVEERMMGLWEARGEKSFLKCDYFYANHHFHGSVSDAFIRYINPKVVFVSAQAAVYARAAYTTVYKEGIQMCNYPGKRLQDTLLSCEVGSVRVKVYKDRWTYECIDDLSSSFPSGAAVIS